jgi:hypothetical protein
VTRIEDVFDDATLADLVEIVDHYLRTTPAGDTIATAPRIRRTAIAGLNRLIQAGKIGVEPERGPDYDPVPEMAMPVPEVNDVVYTHNGFAATITQVAPERPGGDTIQLKNLGKDGKPNVDLGWWRPDQIATVTRDAQ